MVKRINVDYPQMAAVELADRLGIGVKDIINMSGTVDRIKVIDFSDSVTPPTDINVIKVYIKNELLILGLNAFKNWSNLTNAQKDKLLKTILAYLLYKEGVL